MLWRRFTTNGAVASMVLGISAFTDLSLQLFRSTSSSIPQRFSLLRTQAGYYPAFPYCGIAARFWF